MEPRVAKRERRLHLSYELPHRILCAQICSQSAPNGSTLIIYGHDRGLRVLWRGGRRRKSEDVPPAPPQRPNGSATGQEIIIIDEDDEGQTEGPHHDTTDDAFEEEEDELDPDCPYPSIIQDVALDLGSAVLTLALTNLPSSSKLQAPGLLKAYAIAAVACADGMQRVLSIPLSPPAHDGKPQYVDGVLETLIQLPAADSLPHSLAVKVVDARDNASLVQSSIEESGQEPAGVLLLASVSEKLNVYRLSILEGSLMLASHSARHTAYLPSLATHVSFHPAAQSTQLLVTDLSGAARTYDPYIHSTRKEGDLTETRLGKWIMAYHTSFMRTASSLPRRKRILAARWVMGGKAIIVLLEDGEWGVWDSTRSPQTGKTIEDFALRGSLAPSAGLESADPAKQRRSTSKLAPMTPNTRKTKAEALFSGAPKASNLATRGGISIRLDIPQNGHSDESVVIWCGSDVYSIPSMQAFWQRSTTNTNGGGFGSLYSPVLTNITDVNLMSENITSISQFGNTKASSNLGHMNMQRDVLVSAEHRFIILQSFRPQTLVRSLFQQAVERPTSQDQRMLDFGQLDLGGVDRMLDSMANGDSRTRRVGFAQ